MTQILNLIFLYFHPSLTLSSALSHTIYMYYMCVCVLATLLCELHERYMLIYELQHTKPSEHIKSGIETS